MAGVWVGMTTALSYHSHPVLRKQVLWSKRNFTRLRWCKEQNSFSGGWHGPWDPLQRDFHQKRSKIMQFTSSLSDDLAQRKEEQAMHIQNKCFPKIKYFQNGLKYCIFWAKFQLMEESFVRSLTPDWLSPSKNYGLCKVLFADYWAHFVMSYRQEKKLLWDKWQKKQHFGLFRCRSFF